MNTSPAPAQTSGQGTDRALLLGVLWPGRPAPSALVEAERGLATLFLLLRVGVLAVIVVGSITGFGESAHPMLYASLAVVMVFHIAGMVVLTWRAEAVLPRWGLVDLAVSLAAIIGCGVLLPADVVVGTWESWGSGYATGTAAAVGVWCRRPRMALVLVISISAVYSVTAVACSDADLTTVVGNSATYPIFGITAILFSAYWRRLAAGADTATAQAIQAAAEIQVNRYRLMVHDLATILHLLGDENTPTVRLAALRRQATEESHRLRAYLNDTPTLTVAALSGNPPETVMLGAVIAGATTGFTDLPLYVFTELAANAAIPGQCAGPLSAAVATLLHNVRRHAAATDVTVHADTNAETWEVVVRDNGCGFDPETVRYGFGLQNQVTLALAEHHITTQVQSAPGRGTTITLTGSTQPPTRIGRRRLTR